MLNLSMRFFCIPLLSFLTIASPSLDVLNGQQSFPLRNLSFEPTFPLVAHEGNHPVEYIVLGSGWLRTLSARNGDEFVQRWLDSHPNAIVMPICRSNMARSNLPPRWSVYVWIEDGADCLNVSLIQEGIYPGGVMLDMVEAEKRLWELSRIGKLAEVRQQLDKERAARSAADFPKRLISDADYNARRRRIEAAEISAKKEKKGIWSDEMKGEREVEGFPD